MSALNTCCGFIHRKNIEIKDFQISLLKIILKMPSSWFELGIKSGDMLGERR